MTRGWPPPRQKKGTIISSFLRHHLPPARGNCSAISNQFNFEPKFEFTDGYHNKDLLPLHLFWCLPTLRDDLLWKWIFLIWSVILVFPKPSAFCRISFGGLLCLQLSGCLWQPVLSVTSLRRPKVGRSVIQPWNSSPGYLVPKVTPSSSLLLTYSPSWSP